MCAIVRSRPCCSALGISQTGLCWTGEDGKLLLVRLATTSTPYSMQCTPMFISVELSSAKKIRRGLPHAYLLNALLSRLADAEKHCGELFNRIFPNPEENDVFMKNVGRVFEYETTRYKTGITSYMDPLELHGPHHDIESFYWVLLWVFVGGHPKGKDPESTVDYTTFCEAMINHTLGNEGPRKYYLFYRNIMFEPFHSEASRFLPLFENMATYLSIPWKDYDVQPDHAHLAFLRLLLMEIIALHKDPNRNIEFEKMPRPVKPS